MARVRISATVDTELWERARTVRRPGTDSSLVEAALHALIDQHRAAEFDAAYATYDEKPLTEPDAWGDLASFRAASAGS